MRLDGNPSASWDASVPSAERMSSTSFVWKSSSSVGANQNIITNDILSEGSALQNIWANSNYILITPSTNNGNRLSTGGQSYFTNVLPSLGLLAPNAILTGQGQKSLITTPSVTTTSIDSDMKGSSLDLTASAAALHVGGMWLGIILTLGITIWCCVAATKEANSYKPFILLTLPLIYLFTRIGWFPILLTIGLGLVAVFSLYYVFFYEKSSS
jgi:hypothetical protein